MADKISVKEKFEQALAVVEFWSSFGGEIPQLDKHILDFYTLIGKAVSEYQMLQTRIRVLILAYAQIKEGQVAPKLKMQVLGESDSKLSRKLQEVIQPIQLYGVLQNIEYIRNHISHALYWVAGGRIDTEKYNAKFNKQIEHVEKYQTLDSAKIARFIRLVEKMVYIFGMHTTEMLVMLKNGSDDILVWNKVFKHLSQESEDLLKELSQGVDLDYKSEDYFSDILDSQVLSVVNNFKYYTNNIDIDAAVKDER